MDNQYLVVVPAQVQTCRRCGDVKAQDSSWAGHGDYFPGQTQPHPGGLGLCGDLHDWE